MKPLVLLDPRTGMQPADHDPKVRARVEAVDVYDLGAVDLTPFVGLVVTGTVDQEFLWARREVISAFLDDGKVVVFLGHLLRPWLPGCGEFLPAPIRSFRDYVVDVVEPAGVFAGIDPDDLTFRRGVAGFFARGHHVPPAGAEVLATLAADQPTTWIDRTTTPGTVFVHTGDVLGFADQDTSAARLAPQILDWAIEEGSRTCRR